MTDFRDLLKQYEQDITFTAFGQKVVGYDHDDIVQEMTMCLWRAGDTWSEDFGVPFGAYWWSLWKNRQADMIREQGRLKRPVTVAVPEVREVSDRSYTMGLMPEPPRDANERERMIWLMLACGETTKNILDALRISKRSYYSVIKSWRSDEVRSSLYQY